MSTYDDNSRPLHAPASITYNWSEHNYTYDTNGNLTGAPDFSDPFYISFPRNAYNSINYNADNMPIRIENRKDDGAMVSTLAVDFIYDGNGTRAKKALSTGDTTYYIGDHFEVVNGEETKYIFAGNQRIAKVTTGNSYFYQKDHLGSSSVMTDYPAGSTVETTEYLPFGHERGHTGTNITDYKFTDQEKDTETGLYNYDARMYDPVIARFITADSIISDWYDPQLLNRYSYVRNNPLIYIDPSGFKLEVGAHTAVAGSFRHTSTIITLDTPELINKFGNNKYFEKRNTRGKQYATIGAGPVYGKLKSDPNRDRDRNLDIKDEIVDVKLKGKNEVNVIRELFENDSNYDDDLNYDFLPNRPNAVDEYNSNSYTSGLLKSVGLEPPSLQSTTPGYSKPVPRDEFNENSSHREDDLH